MPCDRAATRRPAPAFALLAAALLYVSGIDAASGAEAALRDCLTAAAKSPDAQGLVIAYPGDADFDWARGQYNVKGAAPTPAAVAYAHSTEEVAAAAACASRTGTKLSPAAGRQSFQGMALRDGALVVDVSNLTSIEIDRDAAVMTTGAGPTNTMLIAALHDANMSDWATTVGVCSFVGIGGWMLGGGYGLPGRLLGLGCDRLLSLTYVLANGTVVEANATSHPDLFWASCGGGGGTLGIVTRFKLRATQLPEGGRVTEVTLQYEPGGVSARAARRFLEGLPSLDRRFGFTHSFNNGFFQLTGVFFGGADEAQRLLEEAGMLEGLATSAGAPPPEPGASAALQGLLQAGHPKDGLTLRPFDSLYEFLLNEPLPFYTALSPRPMPWGPDPGNFTAIPENLEVAEALAHGEPGWRIVGGPSYKTWHFTESRLTGLMSEETLEAVLNYTGSALERCIDASARTGMPTADCYLQVAGHVLSGAYSDPAPNATAYPHRGALWVMDATVTVTYPAINFVESNIPQAAPGLQRQANDLAKEFLSIIAPAEGGSPANYANYLPDTPVPEENFWGSNLPRLRTIKAAYDPAGLFDKPMTVRSAAELN